MYDEFERAMTGRSSSSGISVLGWLAAAFGFVVLVGLVGVGFAINHAVHKAEDFARNVDVSRLADIAQLANLDEQRALITMDPDQGLEFLRGLERGNPAEAFMGRMVRGALELGDLPHAPRAPEVPEPGLSAAPPLPEVPAVSQDGRRSLVINADGEQVRFDLVRTDRGATLAIDSEDGNVRFDLMRGESGGQLVIRTDGGTFRLGVGDEAQAMPRWVPRLEGMPERPRAVYSLDCTDGMLGAVAWSGSASASEILSFYRGELEAQGYDLRDEMTATEDGSDEGAFWARNEADGRVVFVVAHAQDGVTKVLLGYGEGR